MANIFIIHGINGTPEENWFPWLKEKLEAQGHRVFVPAFPHTEKPLLQEWSDAFSANEKHLDDHTILVGHSLGGAFLLRLLERIQKPVLASFLVAPVPGPLKNEFDPLMETFSHHPFDIDRIRKNCPRFFVYHADNDPYIPLENVQQLSKNLKAEFRLMPGGGHLNAKAGYASFEALLKDIEQVLGQQ